MDELREALKNIILEKVDFETMVNWMAHHGQSIILNWGDDSELWEVAWIPDGKRYCGFSKSPRMAIIQAAEKYRATLYENPAP